MYNTGLVTCVLEKLHIFKMVRLLLVVLSVFIASVFSKPVEDTIAIDKNVHHLWKRFISTALATGNFDDIDNSLSKLRTRRGVGDECEKLQLCKLHARSSGNFFAAYELYFVNKENAKLWDHQTHTVADCERRFAGCYSGTLAKTNKVKSYRSDDYDYHY